MSSNSIDTKAVTATPLTPSVTRDQAALISDARRLLDAEDWAGAEAAWKGACADNVPGRTPAGDAQCTVQHAHCVSKNKGLALDDRTRLALRLLAPVLSNNPDQEALGVAGGIYKRRWDAFHQIDDLRGAHQRYTEGWTRARMADDGYTGINAAYVTDLLAFEDFIGAGAGETATAIAKPHHDEAQTIRSAIVEKTSDLESLVERRIAMGPLPISQEPWWILVTLAEAHFGLAFDLPEHAPKVREYLERAMDLKAPHLPADWMLETTARQLARMARLQERIVGVGPGGDAAWAALDVLLAKVPAVRTELAGKVGLALSGGGFRASLFHIGVLARLAELDLLRHVEVLSCVSGGSILGAAYYLKLRELLQAKSDDAIKPEDYVGLVQGLEHDFLETIQKNNFRLRMLERFTANFQMLRDRASRTESIGRVMDREMFGGKDNASLRMSDIGIQPAGETPAFRRDDHNWRRKHKVPLLVLNATNQGTGHGWHFTPEEMGEPTTSKIDAIPALARRAYRGDAPEYWRAVTASACVPAIFEPIGLTFGTDRLNLLDGGVHDNQGSSALLDRDCTLVLVSDASGQLARDRDPSRMALAVGKRAESIEAARLREALYAGLEARKRGSLLRGVMFLHLRLGLGDDENKPTEYGLTSKLQRQLSEIRTDLDVFHDVEAHGLMLSGYRMTAQQLPEQLEENAPIGTVQQAEWGFRKAEGRFLTPSSDIHKLLEASSAVTFKAWHVVPALKWIARGLAVIGIAALVALVYWAWQSPMVFTLHSIVKWAVGVVLLYFAQKMFRVKVPNWKREAAFAVVALVGAGIAFVHKQWIDKKYLEAGRL